MPEQDRGPDIDHDPEAEGDSNTIEPCGCVSDRWQLLISCEEHHPYK